MGVGYPGSAFFDDMYPGSGLNVAKDHWETALEEIEKNRIEHKDDKPMSKEEIDEYINVLYQADVKFIKNLWRMIQISDTDVQRIKYKSKIDFNNEDVSLLILYFLIKECGADQDWEDTNNRIQKDIDNKVPYAEYICDSQYSSYMAFKALRNEIKKKFGFLEDIKGVKYSEYIESLVEYLKEESDKKIPYAEYE